MMIPQGKRAIDKEALTVENTPEGRLPTSSWTVRGGATNPLISPGGEAIEGQRVGDAVDGNQITSFTFCPNWLRHPVKGEDTFQSQ